MSIVLIPGVFFMLFILERLIPQVDSKVVKKGHDLNNIGLGVINLVIGRSFSIIVIFTLIKLFSAKNLGLFNIIELDYKLEILTTLVILDSLNYWWHRLIHKVPFLWTLHNIHHTERLLNVSSALRFHIFEILLGSLFRLPFIFLFGISIRVLILYEIILNLNVYFHHSNIRVNKKIDWFLSKVIITPDIHRVHHSLKLKKSYNFSSVLIIWDKLFNSFHPQEDSSKLKYGVPGYSDDKYQLFSYMIRQPFIKDKKG